MTPRNGRARVYEHMFDEEVKKISLSTYLFASIYAFISAIAFSYLAILAS